MRSASLSFGSAFTSPRPRVEAPGRFRRGPDRHPAHLPRVAPPSRPDAACAGRPCRAASLGEHALLALQEGCVRSHTARALLVQGGRRRIASHVCPAAYPIAARTRALARARALARRAAARRRHEVGPARCHHRHRHRAENVAEHGRLPQSKHRRNRPHSVGVAQTIATGVAADVGRVWDGGSSSAASRTCSILEQKTKSSSFLISSGTSSRSRRFRSGTMTRPSPPGGQRGPSP